uniref:Ribosomal protein n=1 Tax=Trieres chinensis TaxID=1514140 RepID=A0A7S1Z642_TRICV|mmetsp:Transcript_18581/g.37653  ORF Transcript_18581/g.37653 Transcript_18581/m.37653 type:complete len:371 (+) Transcript_18581:250-1362(+)|eukprot:CAMPEP_0183304852 /NCGR_PEP_ID=MMETSP0160_2-20130417/9789_1 /TAXON_ID=2839 ORGANISM="Odontella Sinensis, Strain Grunow 1884" /NCGR_SAMPLE_ID=MMETSP0160_2 /ASSEMBLY_ACC=CAM_ASM_000250 /LENGTH=370 /DNA_ID=CAMNT_0025467971 /DNA_START=222 /DNA_END=1334 /DNA_ORIENTATION=-
MSTLLLRAAARPGLLPSVRSRATAAVAATSSSSSASACFPFPSGSAERPPATAAPSSTSTRATSVLAAAPSSFLPPSRTYVSRAHPRPKVEHAIKEAVDLVLDDIKERGAKREAKFERNLPKRRLAGGLPEDHDFGPYRKWDETVEICVNLNVDPRQPGQNLRGSCRLPHGSGNMKRVVVFTPDEELATAAREAGALHAGGQELVDQVVDGTVSVDSFDVSLATQDAMPILGKAARLLGPRGVMPNAKAGTVVQPENMTDTVRDQVSSAIVPYRTDREGIIHAGLGKGVFGPEQLLDNVRAFMGALQDAKPEAFGKKKKGSKKAGKAKAGKGAKFYMSAFLTSTQGKSYRLDLRTVDPTSVFFMEDLPQA